MGRRKDTHELASHSFFHAWTPKKKSIRTQPPFFHEGFYRHRQVGLGSFFIGKKLSRVEKKLFPFLLGAGVLLDTLEFRIFILSRPTFSEKNLPVATKLGAAKKQTPRDYEPVNDRYQ